MPRVIQSMTNNKQESILVGCAPRTSVATTRYQYRVVIPSIPPTPLVYPPPSLVYPPTPSIPTCLVYPPNTPPHSWKGTGPRHTYSPQMEHRARHNHLQKGPRTRQAYPREGTWYQAYPLPATSLAGGNYASYK